MPIPLDGIGLGAAGNSSTANGYTKIRTIKKEDQKSPCVEGLEVLRGLLLKKSPKQGLGQSPKVLFLLHQQTGVNGQREYRVARLAKENAVVRVVEKVNLVNRLLPEIKRDRPLRRGIVLIVVRQKR